MIYEWYEVVEGGEIQQGDIIRACQILVPPVTLFQGQSLDLKVEEYDVIVMSQSCDLVQKKIKLVLVCPIWQLQEFERENANYKSPKMRESIRRGQVPGYHMLNKCVISGFETEYQIVDFKSTYAVHIDFLTEFVATTGKRIRLLPPYREHLSQAFARFFMRVGLPTDIAPFK